MISTYSASLLLLKKWVSYFLMPFHLFILFFISHFLLGHRLIGMQHSRDRYKQLIRQKKTVIICANHLNYSDSLILHRALGNIWFYLRYPRALSWNLPSAKYKSNLYFYLACHTCKCLFVETGGSENRNKILDKCKYLVHRGESLVVFPEGRRSLTGRIDRSNMKYGIGEMATASSSVHILCLYTRSFAQDKSSKFHPKGPIMVLWDTLKIESKDKVEIASHSLACLEKLEQRCLDALSNKSQFF